MLPHHNTRRKVRYLYVALLIVGTIIFSGCGAAESAAPAQSEMYAAPEAEALVEVGMAEAVEEAIAADTGRTSANLGATANTPNVYKRLIIKNAEIELVVEDTDIAINRSLGIVTEFGGYVVSNRTWFSGELKYATVTTGVPTENFEEMLRRFKDLGLKVTNETVSGQDVTDEFVDLESRLRNLNTTAERIRTFMDLAQDVDESLAVSARLGEIEAEVEQVKGRMNYLKDRAAFSTITMQLTPEQPEPIVAKPEPWGIGQSVKRASQISGDLASGLYRIVVEVTVFVVIVLLPFLLPVGLLLWVGIKLLRRMGTVKAKAS